LKKRRPSEFQQLLEGIRTKLALVSAFQSRQAALGLPLFTEHCPLTPKSRPGLASRLHGKFQQLFPKWTHLRDRCRWERRWLNPEFSPFWKTDEPQKEIVDVVESGWFPKNQPVIDLGCGSGEICRWLAGQGFAVLGLDYSRAAIASARRLSAGRPKTLTFEIADLCSENLRLEPAFSLIDRGCFHRIVKNLRPVFARNIAQATLEGGHFLLIAGTFQDGRVVNHRAIPSEQGLREHVKEIFGNHFIIERAEATFLNAREGQESMPALAFWMVRNSQLTHV
jgi:SAM-dependent methyltransferase